MGLYLNRRTLRQLAKALSGGLCMLCGCALVALADGSAISVKTTAEVVHKSDDGARTAVQLVPAERVVAGDLVIYTLEVRNTAAATIASPSVSTPIPQHMTYVADSAVGPGAVVAYSVDGGQSYDRPENLFVHGRDGKARAAQPVDYTNIRWTFKNSLKSDSVAFVRFSAVLN